MTIVNVEDNIMNILALNKTQTKKLLQLCKEFFSEYDWITINKNDSILLCKYEKTITHPSHHCCTAGEAYVIHWYQLCLTDLPERIADKLDVMNDKISDWFSWDDVLEQPFFQSLVHDISDLSKHPVDFLWDFVKECKEHKFFKGK